MCEPLSLSDVAELLSTRLLTLEQQVTHLIQDCAERARQPAVDEMNSRITAVEKGLRDMGNTFVDYQCNLTGILTKEFGRKQQMQHPEQESAVLPISTVISTKCVEDMSAYETASTGASGCTGSGSTTGASEDSDTLLELRTLVEEARKDIDVVYGDLRANIKMTDRRLVSLEKALWAQQKELNLRTRAASDVLSLSQKSLDSRHEEARSKTPLFSAASPRADDSPRTILSELDLGSLRQQVTRLQDLEKALRADKDLKDSSHTVFDVLCPSHQSQDLSSIGETKMPAVAATSPQPTDTEFHIATLTEVLSGKEQETLGSADSNIMQPAAVCPEDRPVSDSIRRSTSASRLIYEPKKTEFTGCHAVSITSSQPPAAACVVRSPSNDAISSCHAASIATPQTAAACVVRSPSNDAIPGCHGAYITSPQPGAACVVRSPSNDAIPGCHGATITSLQSAAACRDRSPSNVSLQPAAACVVRSPSNVSLQPTAACAVRSPSNDSTPGYHAGPISTLLPAAACAVRSPSNDSAPGCRSASFTIPQPAAARVATSSSNDVMRLRASVPYTPPCGGRLLVAAKPMVSAEARELSENSRRIVASTGGPPFPGSMSAPVGQPLPGSMSAPVGRPSCTSPRATYPLRVACRTPTTPRVSLGPKSLPMPRHASPLQTI